MYPWSNVNVADIKIIDFSETGEVKSSSITTAQRELLNLVTDVENTYLFDILKEKDPTRRNVVFVNCYGGEEHCIFLHCPRNNNFCVVCDLSQNNLDTNKCKIYQTSSAFQGISSKRLT